MITARQDSSARRPVAVTAALTPYPPGRRCDCGNPLSRWNRGPECNPCKERQRLEVIAALTGPVATHAQRCERVLAHLETGPFTLTQLCSLMGCEASLVAEALEELAGRGRIERAPKIGHINGWRIVAVFPGDEV